MSNRFVPCETFQHVAIQADASVNSHTFVVPYKPNGMIGQIHTVTTGALNVSGATVLYAYNTTDKTHTVVLAVTTLQVGDIINLIMW